MTQRLGRFAVRGVFCAARRRLSLALSPKVTYTKAVSEEARGLPDTEPRGHTMTKKTIITRKQAGVIYRNVKQGALSMSKKAVSAMYDVTDLDLRDYSYVDAIADQVERLLVQHDEALGIARHLHGAGALVVPEGQGLRRGGGQGQGGEADQESLHAAHTR